MQAFINPAFGTLAFVWPNWLVAAVTVAFLAVCVIMVLTVLIQKPQGGGLASAFGGGASAGQTAFGTKTGDALTVFTIAVFVLYLLGAVMLNYAARPQVAPAVPEASGTPAPTDTTAPADGTAPSGGQSGPVVTPPVEGASPTTAPETPATGAPAATPGEAPAADPKTPATPGSSQPAPATPAPASPAPGNPEPTPQNPEPTTGPGR